MSSTTSLSSFIHDLNSFPLLHQPPLPLIWVNAE